MAFPAPPQLELKMAAAGLKNCGHELLTGGIAAITWGTR
jgi:ubiquinone/menaquinone biosynthesis C-methylase UbiE